MLPSVVNPPRGFSLPSLHEEILDTQDSVDSAILRIARDRLKASPLLNIGRQREDLREADEEVILP